MLEPKRLAVELQPPMPPLRPQEAISAPAKSRDTENAGFSCRGAIGGGGAMPASKHEIGVFLGLEPLEP